MNKKKLKILLAIELHRAYAVAYLIYLKRLQEKNRRYAVRETLKRRRTRGYFYTLIPKIRMHDVESFKNFHLMDPNTFDELLYILGPHLTMKPTKQSEEITPAERLAVTLRYLASGDSMKSIGFYGFRIGASTTSKIIKETCHLIWEKLQFVFPTHSANFWENIAQDFYSKWEFPNCLGAINGKHVIVQAIPNHNTLTFNYKKSNSLVLMVVADANYKFVLIDIGALGRYSDECNFENSKFGKAILHNAEELRIPNCKNFPGTNDYTPLVFLGDETFPLRTNLMSPFPRRNMGNLPSHEEVFNERLSRARKVVDNAFGVLASRFRIFKQPIIASKETVVNIVRSTICLHNWLRDKLSSGYFCYDYIDIDNEDGTITTGLWHQYTQDGLQPLGRMSSNYPSKHAVNIRNVFTNYFNNLHM